MSEAVSEAVSESVWHARRNHSQLLAGVHANRSFRVTPVCLTLKSTSRHNHGSRPGEGPILRSELFKTFKLSNFSALFKVILSANGGAWWSGVECRPWQRTTPKRSLGEQTVPLNGSRFTREPCTSGPLAAQSTPQWRILFECHTNTACHRSGRHDEWGLEQSVGSTGGERGQWRGR